MSPISSSMAAFEVHRLDPNDSPDSLLVPNAIAETYWQIANQPTHPTARDASVGIGPLGCTLHVKVIGAAA
jgi:hypothetical protein